MRPPFHMRSGSAQGQSRNFNVVLREMTIVLSQRRWHLYFWNNDGFLL